MGEPITRSSNSSLLAALAAFAASLGPEGDRGIDMFLGACEEGASLGAQPSKLMNKNRMQIADKNANEIFDPTLKYIIDRAAPSFTK